MKHADKSGYQTIALVVSSSLFMQYFDSMALITVLPTIARDFGRPVLDLNILLSCHALAIAVLIPVCSALSGRFGAKRAFVGALALFLIGSICSALSFNLATLLCARLVQATGAAMMLPVGRLIVVQAAHPSQLVSALNWLLIPSIIGPVSGPPLSGLIVTYGSWQWVFLVNLPIGLIGIAATFWLIPDAPPEGGDERFDYSGAALMTVALVNLVFGFDGISTGRNFPLALAQLLAAFVFGLLYLRHAGTHPAPLLRIDLMRIDSFRVATSLGSLLRSVIGATNIVIPLLLQLGYAFTPAASGAMSFAIPAGALVSRVATSFVLRVMTLRTTLMLFSSAMAALIAAIAHIDPVHAPMSARLALFALGFLSTMPLTLATAIAYVDVPDRDVRAATGFYTTLQQLTISFGVMMATAMLSGTQWATGWTNRMPAVYHLVLYGLAALTLGGIILAMRLKSDAGAMLRPRAATLDTLGPSTGTFDS